LFTEYFVFYFLAEQQTCYHDSGVSVTPPPPRDVTITTRVMQRTNKKRPILTLAGVRRRQLTRREKILYKVEVVEDFSLSHFQKKPKDIQILV
jgi:hypothetical protein